MSFFAHAVGRRLVLLARPPPALHALLAPLLGGCLQRRHTYQRVSYSRLLLLLSDLHDQLHVRFMTTMRLSFRNYA